VPIFRKQTGFVDETVLTSDCPSIPERRGKASVVRGLQSPHIVITAGPLGAGNLLQCRLVANQSGAFHLRDLPAAGVARPQCRKDNLCASQSYPIHGNLTAFDEFRQISGRLRDLVRSGDRRQLQGQRRAPPVGDRSVLVERSMFTQRLKSCFVVSPMPTRNVDFG
jgi:hypothetical protein